MKDLKNLEIIQLNTVEGKLIATLSYKDTSVSDLNDGYAIIDVPVNIRTLQLSSRDNILINQSVKEISEASNEQ